MITTFYSYKGGTGRTMAVANCACLTARGDVDPDRPGIATASLPRVLAIDWDLEAPGLHRYFQSLPPGTITPTALASLDAAPGVIELFVRLRDAIDEWVKEPVEDEGPPPNAGRKARGALTREALLTLFETIELENHVVPLGIGGLSVMKAGRYDDTYASRVNGFRWDELFARSPLIFSTFAELLNARYDYVFIDSRTGTTDTSDICTTLLPEKLAVVFTPNLQSLTGVWQLVMKATAYRRRWGDLRPLSVFPVPSRLENAMPELLRRWREGDDQLLGYQREFERLLDEAYGTSGCSLKDYFDNVGIQHVPDYAFGEPIAVEIEEGTRLSLRRSYQVLTQRLLGLRAPWESMAAALAQQEIGALVATLRDASDTSQTVSAALRALQLHREHPEIEDPSLGVELERIAGTRMAQRQFADAEQLFEGAITVTERAFGAEAVEAANVIERYARALFRAASPVDKDVSSEESVRMQRKAAEYVRVGLRRKVDAVGDGADVLFDSYDLAADIFARAGFDDESLRARDMARRIRPAAAPTDTLKSTRGPLAVFISYAREDDQYKLALLKHLKPLERAGLLAPWHDRMIVAGERWGSQIDAHLEEADIIVLLVSASFLASDYCYDVEMKRALERQSAGEARVIPIIVTPSSWSTAPFAHLQALPDHARAIALWPNQEVAWAGIAEALERLARGALAHGVASAPSHPVDPTRYLMALRDQNSFLEIRGMGAQVVERMELAQVYTRLSVAAPRRESSPSGRRAGPGGKAAADVLGDEFRAGDSRRELRDVMADNPHAALVGDPGSGKTTFLRYVAQNLARAHLGEQEALARIGLQGEAPFPILVRLSQLARFLVDNPVSSYADDAPEHFYRYLEFSLTGDNSYGLPSEYLRRMAQRGGCLLLLDGLDEVPGDPMRDRMVRLIERLVMTGRSINRHLITCRTRAYQGRVQLAGDVATLRLAPLERPQVQEFAEAWSRALYRVDAADPDRTRVEQATAYRDDLLRAIEENPSGATFSESPLMLTVLAVVHWNQKRLPEQRAELYDVAVNYLLESRRDYSAYPAPLRREGLQAVAIAMFEDGEGVQRTLGRPEAAAAIRKVLNVSQSAALDFMENEELYSGVLVSRTEGEVEFWHLTFQEYLAALELSQANDWDRVAKHLSDDRWLEVVLLLAGCERRQGGVRAARRMIERVLTTGIDTVSRARAVGLVGRILHDIRAYGGDPEQGTTYAKDLEKTLAIFEPGAEEVPEPIRVEVGEALGQADDPRLDDSNANRVLIPAGSFWMGAQKTDPNGRGYDAEEYGDEGPVHHVSVSAIRIGRYPVTVAEYRRFVERGAEGYLKQQCWDPRGWAWRSKGERTEPGEWAQQRAHLNRPVTSVSWYEADAYCRWAGGRLPTEAEWEWVARGAEGRRYPWGNDGPTERHANFDGRVGSPTPVGIYPGDAHEYGVRDLAGNVWEWCGDWFAPYDPDGQRENPAGPDTGASRVLRGGAFNRNARGVRSAHRFNLHPEYENDHIGFRVVWSVAGGH